MAALLPLTVAEIRRLLAGLVWRLAEVYRADLPWCAPSPQPGQYTTDQELAEIIGSVDIEV